MGEKRPEPNSKGSTDYRDRGGVRGQHHRMEPFDHIICEICSKFGGCFSHSEDAAVSNLNVRTVPSKIKQEMVFLASQGIAQKGDPR